MPDSPAWSVADIPSQAGRTAVVTGANSGLGFQTALALAGAGAHVVLACRDAGKGKQAEDTIRRRHPQASLEVAPLDLANLASIRAFAAGFGSRRPALDLLINNAGVMALPLRRTADGFEMQLGTNHLGHFALTGLLLDRLLAAPEARVVTVSSTMHRIGRIRFDDLQSERGYSKWGAYGQSKLANLLFAYELERRIEAAGRRSLRSLAAHPGYAATELQAAGPRMEGSGFMERVMALGNRFFSQDAASGALPTLYAATANAAVGGGYYGPGGFMEVWGPPVKVASSARSRDRETARRLWSVSEELTGVRYDALATSA